ncbi:MAG: hypothetical protein JNG85_06350 [Spirochaetaceae bacterium]|nr:hypothetical protein [Spirochaetaceae bacterium]
MEGFTAIDFETGNPQRVSACAIGYAIVEHNEIVKTGINLIKPVGGHAAFQTRIHGITEEHTKSMPMFNELYPCTQDIFSNPIVGHSQFDKQVLNALSEYFGLGMRFEYFDSISIAKSRFPDLKNHKLDTVAKHLGLPEFTHHDALEDAKTCARIVLKIGDKVEKPKIKISYSMKMEYCGLLRGVVADE